MDKEEVLMRSILFTQRVVDRITEFILFMFILEMRDVRLKLQSATPDDYIIALKDQKTLSVMNKVVLVAISLPLAVLRFFYPGGT